MILINDEKRGLFIDLEIMKLKISNQLEMLLKDIDNEKLSPPKRAEIIDAIATYESQLHKLIETAKVPFDVLVVIENGEIEKAPC